MDNENTLDKMKKKKEYKEYCFVAQIKHQLNVEGIKKTWHRKGMTHTEIYQYPL